MAFLIWHLHILVMYTFFSMFVGVTIKLVNNMNKLYKNNNNKTINLTLALKNN